MKLDKIAFAQVIGYIYSLLPDKHPDAQYLNDLIDVEVPTQVSYPAADSVNMLMFLMAEGKQKIAAIKLHRQLTGYGLKESKDEVEKHWGLCDGPDAKLLDRIKQALGTSADGDDLVQVAKDAYRNSEELASQHMENSDEGATLGSILRKATGD